MSASGPGNTPPWLRIERLILAPSSSGHLTNLVSSFVDGQESGIRHEDATSISTNFNQGHDPPLSRGSWPDHTYLVLSSGFTSGLIARTDFSRESSSSLQWDS